MIFKGITHQLFYYILYFYWTEGKPEAVRENHTRTYEYFFVLRLKQHFLRPLSSPWH